MTDPIQDALAECEKALDESKKAGGLAEKAADAFRQLGTRVDGVLEERRVQPDRRSVSRAAADRRKGRKT